MPDRDVKKGKIDLPRVAALERYLDGGADRVEGWLDAKSARIIASLSLHQIYKGLNGAIGEIGIHHGRLFLLMRLASRTEDNAIAIDVFRQQDLNIGHSGKGDRDIFERNLTMHGIDPGSISIVAKSSFDVSGDDVLRAVGAVRLLSIDGGHTPECLVNDMQIADKALAEHGVVIIDDVFNYTWPGVITGYTEYLSRSPRIVPFAASPNKVYACPARYGDHYRRYFRDAFAREYDRSDHFFGFAVDTYGAWRKPCISRRRRIWDALFK